MTETAGIPTLRELVDLAASELRTGEGCARENPRREASLLLQAAVGMTVGQILARGHESVLPEDTARFWGMVLDRARGVPLQLITGRSDFHEITLKMEPGVFIPRPETELLVEEARLEIEKRLPGHVRVLDLCTGTGAIAVALAGAFRDLRQVRLFAGDWNPRAVRLARHNARANEVTVDVRRSELFSAFADIEGRVDVLVSNPPYLAPHESAALPLEVRLGDPEEALIDPSGGTGFHRRLATRGRDFLRSGGLLALEIGETQGREVADIVTECDYDDVRVVRDLAGRERFVVGRKRGTGPSTRSS